VKPVANSLQAAGIRREASRAISSKGLCRGYKKEYRKPRAQRRAPPSAITRRDQKPSSRRAAGVRVRSLPRTSMGLFREQGVRARQEAARGRRLHLIQQALIPREGDGRAHRPGWLDERLRAEEWSESGLGLIHRGYSFSAPYERTCGSRKVIGPPGADPRLPKCYSRQLGNGAACRCRACRADHDDGCLQVGGDLLHAPIDRDRRGAGTRMLKLGTPPLS